MVEFIEKKLVKK